MRISHAFPPAKISLTQGSVLSQWQNETAKVKLGLGGLGSTQSWGSVYSSVISVMSDNSRSYNIWRETERIFHLQKT